jgi:hypothetical protein
MEGVVGEGGPQDEVLRSGEEEGDGKCEKSRTVICIWYPNARVRLQNPQERCGCIYQESTNTMAASPCRRSDVFSVDVESRMAFMIRKVVSKNSADTSNSRNPTSSNFSSFAKISNISAISWEMCL